MDPAFGINNRDDATSVRSHFCIFLGGLRGFDRVPFRPEPGQKGIANIHILQRIPLDQTAHSDGLIRLFQLN